MPWQMLQHARAGTAVILPRLGRKGWLYIRDAIGAITALLDAPHPVPRAMCNLAAGLEWTVAEWCAALARLKPGFEWSVGANANVDFFGAIDRAVRLIADLGFSPAYTLDRALADYLETETAKAEAA